MSEIRSDDKLVAAWEEMRRVSPAAWAAFLDALAMRAAERKQQLLSTPLEAMSLANVQGKAQELQQMLLIAANVQSMFMKMNKSKDA